MLEASEYMKRRYGGMTAINYYSEITHFVNNTRRDNNNSLVMYKIASNI